MWRLFIVGLVACAHGLPAQESGYSDNEIEGISDCLKKDSTTCLKYKFFSFVDKMLGQRETFSIAEGVTVVKASDAPPEIGAPRSADPLARIKRYLDTHSISFEIKGSDLVDAASGVGRALEEVSPFGEDNLSEESRGKKKKAAKILGPLMAAVAMKMMALIPVAIGVIAIIAGKALLIGKIALVLSAIIGLKKLLAQQKHVTYEVVTHPHHSSGSSHDYGTSGYGGGGGGGDSSSYGSSSHGGSGWGRNMDAQAMAYAEQKP